MSMIPKSEMLLLAIKIAVLGVGLYQIGTWWLPISIFVVFSVFMFMERTEFNSWPDVIIFGAIAAYFHSPIFIIGGAIALIDNPLWMIPVYLVPILFIDAPVFLKISLALVGVLPVIIEKKVGDKVGDVIERYEDTHATLMEKDEESLKLKEMGEVTQKTLDMSRELNSLSTIDDLNKALPRLSAEFIGCAGSYLYLPNEDETIFTLSETFGDAPTYVLEIHSTGDIVGTDKMQTTIYDGDDGGKPIGILVLSGRRINIGGLSNHPSAFSDDDLLNLKIFLEHWKSAYTTAKKIEEIVTMSRTDALTGLSNRAYFTERFSEEIERVKRYKYDLSIVMFDIDNFKAYNTKLGHFVADKALSYVGEKVMEMTRDPDIPGRLGGDEFIVVMPNTNIMGAITFSERLKKAIAEDPFEYENVTLSMGIVAFPQHGSTDDEILKAVDEALYKAKNGGKNRIYAAPESPDQEGIVR